MKRILLAGTSILALASGATGQSFTSDSSITFALRWSEHNGNNNGVLDPGESALLSLDVSFTNQNGLASFTPPLGPFSAGIIRGLGSGYLDFHGSTPAQGSWNVDPQQGYGVAPDWDTTQNGEGTPANGGQDLLRIAFAQFDPTPASIITTNPVIAVWRGLWTPSSYEPRSVTFASARSYAAGPSAGFIALRLSATEVANVAVDPANLMFGSVMIPVVPALPVLPYLPAVVVIVTRRQRAEPCP
jgi:hypothetical protein